VVAEDDARVYFPDGTFSPKDDVARLPRYNLISLTAKQREELRVWRTHGSGWPGSTTDGRRWWRWVGELRIFPDIPINGSPCARYGKAAVYYVVDHLLEQPMETEPAQDPQDTIPRLRRWITRHTKYFAGTSGTTAYVLVEPLLNRLELEEKRKE